jgi:hypothetical protein
MGRVSKFNEDALMAVVGELLTDGAIGWESVAEHYSTNPAFIY